MEIIGIADLSTTKMALQIGQGDVFQMADPQTMSELKTQGFVIQTSVASTTNIVPDTGNADSPFSNKKVREAIEYAIDREGLAKAFSYGFWEAPYQIPGPDSIGYNPNFTGTRKYDPTKAKQLLTEAGYPDDFNTTIIVEPSTIREIITQQII